AAVVERPLAVIFVFLLLTAGFATGIDDITMSAGTDDFSEDVDAYATQELVEETFEQPFEQDSEATLLLYSQQDVLSQSGLVEMLAIQKRVADRPDLHVTETQSVASLVARELDPTARTHADQIRAIERATDSERQAAVRAVMDDPAGQSLLGEERNREQGRAGATIGVVTHDVDEDSLQSVQLETRQIAATATGDMRVFGSGITDYENQQVLKDSLSASIPAVVVLLVLFLAIAFRDPFDVFLGVLAFGMALVWTFGLQGLLGIPFSQLQVAIPPLLLAIGVDFGIHIINRYREEESGGIGEPMRRTLAPLLGAFVMVTLTSAIGFSANMASGLSPIAEFGLVAALGISAVALVFGLFLPAGKVALERLRVQSSIPRRSPTPLGAEDSALGRLLPVPLELTSKVPTLFLLTLVLTAGAAGYYGQDVGSSFEDEDMLPPEDLPDYLDSLPGPMAPGEYTTTANTHFLEDRFETTDHDTVTVYAEGQFTVDTSLTALSRAGRDPPDSFVRDGRQAQSTSINTVIQEHAAESDTFRALVDRNDLNGDGIPDQNLETIYETLLASPSGDRAEQYLSSDYRSTRVVYAVESSASDATVTADARRVADRTRFDAVETGTTVVFQRVADSVFASAVSSLAIALALAAGFLVLVYFLLEGHPELGLVTLSPIVLTVAYLVATMRLLGIPFNTLTATILSVTVGVGIDYSIHVVHRFVEEIEHADPLTAARITLRGTGGALFGTTVTTMSAGLALFALSITPILIQFGLLVSISVAYSFLTSVVVLPVVLLFWARRKGPTGEPSTDEQATIRTA
ncbi:MAG: efflux RND transporter permease subunit, partial [Halobacteriota archaeon]